MEFLKPILGDELYAQVAEKLKGNDKVKLANLADGQYVGKDKFDALDATRKDLKDQLDDRDKQLDALKKLEPEKLQGEIVRLQGENKTVKETSEAALKAATMKFAVRSKLKDDQAVDPDAVMSLMDLGKISLDGDKLIGYDEQIKPIKENKKWAFPQPEVPGAGGNPPPAEGGKTSALPEGAQIL